MADGDDNKEVVQNKNGKDKTIDLQVLNDIKSILSQISATNNPAELSRLASQAQGLKSDNPAINEIIEKVQSIATRKQENSETQLNSNINSDNIELQKQLDREIEVQKLLQEQDTIHQEHERLKVQHQQFLKDTDELIEKRQQEIDTLKALNAKSAAGQEITEEDLDKLIKTPEQVEEELKKRQAAEQHRDEATSNHEKALNHQEKLEQEQIKLEKKLEEKRKAVKNPEHPTEKEQAEINTAKKRLNQHVENTQKHKKVVEETKVIKEEAQNKFSKLNNQDLQKETELGKLRQDIDKTKQTDPAKHQKLSSKLDTIENQEKIINGNNRNKNSEKQTELETLNQNTNQLKHTDPAKHQKLSSKLNTIENQEKVINDSSINNNTKQQSQVSANIASPKKEEGFDDLFNVQEEKTIPTNKAQDKKQHVNTSENISLNQKTAAVENKQNPTNTTRTNADIMDNLKDQVKKDPKLSLTQEIKNELNKIVERMRSTVQTIFVPGGASGMSSRGPSIGSASKEKNDTPAR